MRHSVDYDGKLDGTRVSGRWRIVILGLSLTSSWGNGHATTYRGLVKVDPFISAKAPLAEGASWFNRLYNHEPNLMKVILQP